MAKLNKPSLPAPRKVRQHAIPDEIIGKALEVHAGRVTYVADELDIAWSSVQERIAKSPYLQQIKRDSLEKRIDKMEKALDSLVQDKNLGAICFGLKTLGKSRGYTEGTAIMVSNEMAVGLSAMLNQLASAQNALKIANSLPINTE